MIIKLTHDEIKRYVGASLNIPPSSFTLEIEAPETGLLTAFRTAIGESPRHATDQRISAIKRFRELAPKHTDREGNTSCVIGLADAKWAVENADLALANLERTGSIRG